MLKAITNLKLHQKYLNIGLHYEMSVPLEIEREVTAKTNGSDNASFLAYLDALGIKDGETQNDLPGLAAIGIAYNVSDSLKIEIDYTLYMNSSADLEGTLEDDIEDGFDAGVSIEYSISKAFKVSFGCMMTSTGMDVEDMTPEDPELDSSTIGAGAEIKLGEMITVNLAIANSMYSSETTAAGMEYKKSGLGGAFGLQLKF